jgi:hypothetical protein
MANEQNLKPSEYQLTQEEAKKGGIASGIARRNKKAMRENAELLLSLPLQQGKLKEQIRSLGIEDEEITNQMALIVSLFQKAMKGDVTAFNSLQATVGEKPTEKIEHSGTIPVVIEDDIK